MAGELSKERTASEIRWPFLIIRKRSLPWV
jgi:hypothetical protein